MICARAFGAGQRGAALLMATVFMLVVIALFGLISLRMAGTDVIDTSLQSDSVEALFLAESGAERALQRLASGIACDAVAELGTRHTLGRGDFEIRSSSPNAVTGWCDVRVLGRVLLGGTSRAERTIDVSLQRSSGTGAWAVGNGGAVYAWSGSDWSAAASGTTARLNAVHCVSSSECWAVGNNGTIRHWISGSWTGATPASGTTERLLGIACIPGNPSACYAVGNDVIRRWNGSNWSASTFPGGQLNGVSCTSTTCYAVEDDRRIWQLNIATNTWFEAEDFNNDNWNSVHCLATGECWAVGDRLGNDFRFARLQGGTWSTLSFDPPGPGNPAENLTGIYCVASDSCWAVGDRQNGSADTIVRRNAGNFSMLTPAGGRNLRAIACSGASDCLAVGDNGDVQRWNGSSWSQAMTGMANVTLRGVAMTGGGGGSTQLMRWSEVIN